MISSQSLLLLTVTFLITTFICLQVRKAIFNLRLWLALCWIVCIELYMFKPKSLSLVNSLTKARAEKQSSLTKLLAETKARYDSLGSKLEEFDNKKHDQDKICHASDLKAYFMIKMVAGDMQTIEQLVKVNCLIKQSDWGNQVVISGTMFCEPSEYTNAAKDKAKAAAQELFEWDAKILKENFAIARPQSVQMMPELQAATEQTSKKLQKLVSKMKQPVPEIY